MFQDSFLDGRAESRRPWTVAVSLLAQSLAVALAMLFSLLTAGDLPAGQWMAHLLAPPPPPPAAPRPEPARLAPKPAAATRFESELLMPPAIPEKVAVVVDAPSETRGIQTAPGVVGVAGPAGGVSNSVLSQLTAGLVAPPPPSEPKPEPKKPQEPVRVSSELQEARLIHKVAPVYPELAIRMRVSGVVRLEAIVAEDGTIRQLQVLSGHPLLAPSAREAVSRWRYRPTILGGVPVPVVTRIDVNFTLGR